MTNGDPGSGSVRIDDAVVLALFERLPDAATADLLLRLVEFHETTAWMLRVVHSGPDADQLLA